MDARKTLIIIPAFNEEACLRQVIEELQAQIPEHHIFVVDDGSADKTYEIAVAAGVKVARLPFNLGVGSALRTGLQYAVHNGYERALQFDADGQHDPGEIRKLLQVLENGHDIVVGSRFASGGHYRVSSVRGAAIRLLQMLTFILSGRRFSDPSSGFRAFSRGPIEYFSQSYPLDYLSDTVEALLLASYDGFSVGEVPVKMRVRHSGRPSNRNWKLIFHFVRLVLVMLLTATVKGRKGKRTRKVRAAWG